MTTDEILSRLQGARRSGTGWSAKCPAHDDRAASLSVAEGRNGGTVLHCFAGCTVDAICAAIGISPKDLFAAPPKESARQAGGRRERRIVATYDYFTRTGDPICRVVRYDPKGFGRMSPAPGGGWKWGGTTNAAALYRWQELAGACARGEAVYLVEGEKDCDNARKAGLNATTALGGASKWRAEYGREFAGASSVTIVADNDGPGRELAIKAKASIVQAGVPCRAVCLPPEIGDRKVKDISDALSAGWTREEVERWTRDAPEIEANPAPRSSLPAAEIDKSTLRGAILDAIAHAEDDSAAERRNALIPAALEWLRAHGGFYFDAEATDLSGAYYFHRDKRRLMQASGDLFRSWLAWESGINRISVDFRELAASCEDAAAHAEWSDRITPARYWARPCTDAGGAIYLSCGDGAMARIRPNSVEICDNGTDGVLFRAGRTCAEWRLLPKEKCWPLWNLTVFGGASVESPLDPLLLALWILVLPLSIKNRPPLSLCGDIGSGKTRTATGIFEALGIPPRISTADKSDKGDEAFWVSAGYGGITTIDNVDSRCKWLPDAIAAASTGGQREKRKLYSDDELVFLPCRSAIILTSANPLYATDAGLADRLINIQFNRSTRHTSDSKLSDEIAAHRDGAMSWIAWTLAGALAVEDAPPAEMNRRHPDWAAWCWRCGVALGLKAETETALLRAEKQKALVSILSDNLIGAPLYRQLASSGQVLEGTAKAIRNWLIEREEYDERTKAWLTPHRIGAQLRTSRPIYAEVFHMSSRTLHGETWWRLEAPSGSAACPAMGFRTIFSPDGILPECGDCGGYGGHTEAISEKPPENPPNIIYNNNREISQRLSEKGGGMSTTSTSPAPDPDEMPEDWYEMEGL